MKFEIKGLDRLQRELREAQEALKALDGRLGSINFNPHDPDSVGAAISEVGTMIDERVAPWQSNALVQRLAAGLKERYAAGIRDRARKALEGSQCDVSPIGEK